MQRTLHRKGILTRVPPQFEDLDQVCANTTPHFFCGSSLHAHHQKVSVNNNARSRRARRSAGTLTSIGQRRDRLSSAFLRWQEMAIWSAVLPKEGKVHA